MYKIQVTCVKLSDFISSSKFLKANQMSNCMFPSMHYISPCLNHDASTHHLYVCIISHTKKNSKDTTKQNKI